QRSHRPTHFPYTTLFRSEADAVAFAQEAVWRRGGRQCQFLSQLGVAKLVRLQDVRHLAVRPGPPLELDPRGRGTRKDGHLLLDRSEEHTSELQSRENIVC